MGSLVLFLFFLIVNFFLLVIVLGRSVEEATLLGPGGRILGLEPVKVN